MNIVSFAFPYPRVITYQSNAWKILKTICHHCGGRKPIPCRALGWHLLLSSTIMTSLWKLCPKIWLYVYSSRQWAVCHLGIRTSPPLTHTHCVGNDKEVLQTAMQHTGKGMCCGQIYCLWMSYLAPKRRIIVPLVSQCATLKHLHMCIVFSSDIRQARSSFCPSVSHTHSLMGKFQLIEACMFEFEQGVENSPKLRSLGEIGLSL